MLICETEEDALPYLKLFGKHTNPSFSVRRSVDTEWDLFDAEVAKLGLTCRYRYDMIYPKDTVAVPEYEDMGIRLLTIEDMPLIKIFKQSGGCAECHVRAIQIHFDGKGNAGMKPMGVFENGELVCLAMPTLDQIREFRKYDIGAIFTISRPHHMYLQDNHLRFQIKKKRSVQNLLFPLLFCPFIRKFHNIGDVALQSVADFHKDLSVDIFVLSKFRKCCGCNSSFFAKHRLRHISVNQQFPELLIGYSHAYLPSCINQISKN